LILDLTSCHIIDTWSSYPKDTWAGWRSMYRKGYRQPLLLSKWPRRFASGL